MNHLLADPADLTPGAIKGCASRTGHVVSYPLPPEAWPAAGSQPASPLAGVEPPAVAWVPHKVVARGVVQAPTELPSI